MGQVEEDVRTLVRANAGLAIHESQLADETDLFNAGMTSYASVTVMMTLEDHFGVEFPDSMIRRSTFETIAALAAAITSLLSPPPAAQDQPAPAAPARPSSPKP